MSKLTKSQATKYDKEKIELEKKSKFHMVGYNVIRVGFDQKEDADRYLEVLRNLGLAGCYYFYGAECAAKVQSNGPGRGWEVYYG